MNNQLALVIATVGQPEWRRCTDTWQAKAAGPFNMAIVENMELMAAYQHGLETVSAPIVGFVHDDVLVHESGWDKRVLAEFDDPNVGLVGFAGALGHGDPEMYRKPYELVQLARRNFRSNMKDAEVHGERFTGACDVAVLDGMALFVRRQVFDGYSILKGGTVEPYYIGGWPQGTAVGYACYDYWLCCETRRQGYRIRLVGVACEHLNGRSTGMGPKKIDRSDFEAAHRWIYDNYRDVLPYTVQP